MAAAAPSDLLHLSSRVLADAQARLRGLAMASTDLQTIDTLIAKRDAIDAQQNRIMRANLATIDQDPTVKNNIDDITKLTGELAAGVQEMRNATAAIRAATEFISVAEKLLVLFGIP
jgi:erythromycin esterase-like protein